MLNGATRRLCHERQSILRKESQSFADRSHQARDRLQATRTATAAGTTKPTRTIGASSATEYPALATPTHMLIAAPMSQMGMNHRAAAAMPAAGESACTNRAARTNR